MSPQLVEMRRLAEKARQNAYAPYSNLHVGVCLLAENGRYYVGCNVENAAYGLANCAETGATSAMVADGGHRIKTVVIVSSAVEFCPPCGACRQQLYEFSSKETEIVLINKLGEECHKNLLELLPFPFQNKIME